MHDDANDAWMSSTAQWQNIRLSVWAHRESHTFLQRDTRNRDCVPYLWRMTFSDFCFSSCRNLWKCLLKFDTLRISKDMVHWMRRRVPLTHEPRPSHCLLNIRSQWLMHSFLFVCRQFDINLQWHERTHIIFLCRINKLKSIHAKTHSHRFTHTYTDWLLRMEVEKPECEAKRWKRIEPILFTTNFYLVCECANMTNMNANATEKL